MSTQRVSYTALVMALMTAGMVSGVAAQGQTTMDTVVVTASGFEQSVEDAPASITVIPRAELEKRAYRDVTDALRDVPGVLVTGGGSSSDISVRGMSASYTMLLVDGKRQNSRETRPNSDGSGIEQGWLPPLSAIERIEVIRGPMSSLYGSDAMGGVINIITRKVAKTWGGEVRAETTQQGSSSSGDIYQGNFYLAGPIKEGLLGLQIYGQKSQRNEDSFLNGFNKQDTTSGTVKLALTPNQNHDIVLEVGRTLQDRISTPGKTMARETCTRGVCTPNNVSNNNYDQNIFSLTHTGRWGFGTSTTYVQHDKTDNPGRSMSLKNTEFNSQLTMPLGDRNLTTLGMSYKNEKLGDMGNQMKVANPISTLERYQWALFAENEWKVTSAFALTAGLRMNRDENYGTNWSPRLYGVWHASEQFSVKGGVSTGYKSPSLRAAVADWGQITGGGGDAAIIRGNPSLKPEKSTSQEIGIQWDNRVNFSTSLTLFNTDFKDKITEMRTCSDTASGGTAIVTGNCAVLGTPYKFISDRMNVDKANMRGIEATATWNINPDLRLASNYTFTRTEQKSGVLQGKPLNKTPRHMFNTTLDWKATQQLNVWSRLNFRSKTSEYLNRTSMAAGTPAFTFVDLGLNYAIRKDVKLGAGIYNVFNKKVDYTGYGAVYDGRRYVLNVTANF